MKPNQLLPRRPMHRRLTTIEYLIFAWWPSLPPSACLLREYLRSRHRGLWAATRCVARWLEPREQRMVVIALRLLMAKACLGRSPSTACPCSNEATSGGDDRATAHGHHVRTSTKERQQRANDLARPAKCRVFMGTKEGSADPALRLAKSAVMTA